jgi:hypothetical protein
MPPYDAPTIAATQMQMLDHPPQDLGLIVGADGREIGLSRARSRRHPAAAQEIQAEHLTAIGIQRLAGPDDLAPPALLAAADVGDDASGGNAAQRRHQGTVRIAGDAPGDAHVVEATAEMQRQRRIQLQYAVAQGRVVGRRGIVVNLGVDASARASERASIWYRTHGSSTPYRFQP